MSYLDEQIWLAPYKIGIFNINNENLAMQLPKIVYNIYILIKKKNKMIVVLEIEMSDTNIFPAISYNIRSRLKVFSVRYIIIFSKKVIQNQDIVKISYVTYRYIRLKNAVLYVSMW